MDPRSVVPHNVLISGERIAYGIHGNGSAPIVMLHGTPSSSLIWRNIIPHLIRAGYKVHVYDLLGYGLSERPWDPCIDTSITGQVPILKGLLAHWGLQTVNIVAHDIGGGIAQRLAVFNPELVSSLTMIDVVSFNSYPSERTKQQMQRGLESLIRADSKEHREHMKGWLQSAVVTDNMTREGSLDVFLNYISGPVGQASFFEHQVKHYNPKHTSGEVAERISELGKVPVQLIWGKNDAWQKLEWAHKLHESIPGSELTILETCGHFSLEDRPDEIARLVVSFLERESHVG
ncbi:hypothetical protein CBS147346_4511 [Aspergillus niger]|nr:hypothetical protein CBS147346_4511 [Aspergillus niger]